jgi:TolB-like protein/Flp pilus assembly protein TadD
MSNQDEPLDGPLGDLAAAAADGLDLDWSSARRRLADPSHHRLARELETIAALSRALHQDPGEAQALPLPQQKAFPPSAEPPLTIPDSSTSWGPLRIVAEIGRGSFGRVLRAWEPRLQREVALKLLEGVPADSEDAVVAEARLLAQIRHDNVVTVFGADCFDGKVGFWMECIEGRTLWQMHEQSGPFSAQEALLVAVDVCRALAAVHRAGFVHGDVKAQNVMRQVGGRIVLTDFGAARLTEMAAPSRHRTIVTPYYAAPEVLLGAAPTVQSDLYSLGVLLFYLVTGQYPVLGETIEDFRIAHASGRRRLLRDVRPDLPPTFIRVVDAAMTALAEERPESAGALEALIERAAGRVGAGTWTTAPGPADAEVDRSIAVLPFVDLSSDQSLGYFCEGLAEEIIHALSGIAGLHVVPRASAFRVEAQANPQQIRSVLNVKTVLQGSVRVTGSQVCVTARLTDAITGVHLWSERLIRELTDIVGVQEDIANAACRELGVRLAPEARTRTALQHGSHGSDVYTLYLKGRYCWNQRTELALQKSAAYFHAAIEKEPEYAPAYAALAETYTTIGLYGVLAPHDIMPRARSAARRAIEIGGDLASAHATAACIAAVYEWNWRDAAVAYHRAIEVDPDDPSAHHWYAINYLVPLRRFEEAAAELGRAAAADPLSMAIRASVGIRSYFAHDFAQADRELRHSLELDPGSPTARLFLGLTLVEMSRGDDAIRELETATQIAPSPEMSAALAYACARAGRLERARGLLGQLLMLADQRYVSPSLIGQVHAGFGDTDLAIESLQRAAEARAADLSWLAVRPVFDALRSDPRFNGLVARIFQ